jgi:hypothetical protein
MAVELGDQFKDATCQGLVWVVERIVSAPGMISHAIVTQKGDTNSTRMFSCSALEDRNLFQPVKKPPSAAAPTAKPSTWRGLFRIAKKAG